MSLSGHSGTSNYGTSDAFNSAPATASSSEQGARAAHHKRNRTILSCTHCRTAKLKCDRSSPCNQCIHRDRSEQCKFPAPATRKKPAVSMQKRLRHLESLVKDVMSGQMPLDTSTSSSNEGDRDVINSDSSNGSPGQTVGTSEASFGIARAPASVVRGTKESAYIGATHWAAILNDIEEVKTYFDEEEPAETVEESDRPEMSLIFQERFPTSKQELLDGLPNRRAVDILVSRYFKVNNPSKHIIHNPTFQKQYNEFWENPSEASIHWIALLYAVMSIAAFAGLGSGETIPDNRGHPMQVISSYRKFCTRALALGNYARPEMPNMLAFFLYMEGEFMLGKFDQVTSYLLIGVAVRLCLRMGLHRDATKIAGNLSVFEAEQRRRMWHLIVQVDLLASFHIGLPGMVQAIESDTELPRNLRDVDFHEDSTELPPSRPESEMTEMSYSLTKGNIARVFGQIAQESNRLSPSTYNEILRLDGLLNQAFAEVPEFFRIVPIELAITDPTSLVIQRYSIAMLYYKSKCVLHRRYLLEARKNNKFEHSKRAGLDAALQILHFQSSIHDAIQPEGLLAREKWFITSLSIHDFLLAATIVYLALMQVLEDVDTRSFRCENQPLFHVLERAFTVWNETRESQTEARKAAVVLQLMVGKVRSMISNGSQRPVPEVSSTLVAGLSLNAEQGQSPTFPFLSGDVLSDPNSWPREQLDVGFSSNFDALPAQLQQECSMPMSDEGFGNMLDMPTDFDWDIFDSHFRPQMPPNQLPGDSLLPNFDPDNYDSYFVL